MIQYATNQLTDCLNIMENRIDHDDYRIASKTAKTVAEILTQVSNSINSVLLVQEEYQRLLSLFEGKQTGLYG